MQAPRSLSLVPVLGTFLLGFVATVAVVIWREPGSVQAIRWHIPVAAAPAAATRMTSSTTQTATAIEATGMVAPPAQAEGLPDLPVQLSLMKRRGPDDAPVPGDQNFIYVARIHNQSTEPLSLQVRIASAGRPDGAARFDVDAGTLKVFGVDDGLDIHPDDTVTLSAARYKPLVRRVPE
jgi:hypothetical protein